MFKYVNAFTNRSGDSLPGYFAKLFDSSGNHVDIFSDASGTPISNVSGVANAALSDENGMFRWYVANGTYDIRFYDSNDVFVAVEPGIPMIEASGVYDDLADPAAGKGAALVTMEGGGTAQAAIIARPTSATLAAAGGAALVGSTGPSNVQADINARPTSATLAASGGAGLIGVGDTTLAVAAPKTLAEYGALTDGSNATTGIDDALAASRQVEGLTGNYQAQGITLNETGQVILARGSTNFLRNANGAILSTSASDITINGIAFYGNDPTYTGDLLNFTGQRGKLLFCAARDAGSDNVLKITGSAWSIFGVNDAYEGNIHITTDGLGGVSQYHNIGFFRLTGALTLEDTSFVTVLQSLITGAVTVDKGIETAGGHGARFGFSRLTGAMTIIQSNTCIGSGMSSSSNITIGDGVDSFTGIAVDPSFVQQSGALFTVNTGVKGTFHVGNLVADGVTVSIPASVRQASNVYHGEIDYTPTISGGGGSFVLGNGSVSGKYSQQGNVITGRTVLSIGSTTTLPTSGIFTTVPVNTGGRPILCTIDIFVSGVGSYTAVGKIFSDGLRILGWLPQPAAIDNLFTDAVPAALGADDVVTWNFSYALGGV